MTNDFDPTLAHPIAPPFDATTPPVTDYRAYNPLENLADLVGPKQKGAIKKIAGAVKKYAVKVGDYRAMERAIALLKIELIELTKRRNALAELQDPVINAWCADYTDDLASNSVVGTIEVPGDYRETGWTNVAPGYSARAAWSSKIHGQLQFSKTLTPAGFGYNSALQAPVQKWRARWRYAAILALHADGSADVEYEDARSKRIYDMKIDINPSAHHWNVPVRYMDCDSAAFSVGDRALVQFVAPSGESSWDIPTVVGFAERPKICRALVFFDAGPATYDPQTGELLYYSLTQCRIRYVAASGQDVRSVVLNGLTFHSDGAAAADAAHAYILAQDFSGPLDTERAIRIYRANLQTDPPEVAPVGTWTLEDGYGLPKIAADAYFLYCCQRLVTGYPANDRARWGVYSKTTGQPGWQSAALECQFISGFAAWRRWVALVQAHVSGGSNHALQVFEVGETGNPALRWTASISDPNDVPGAVGVGADSVYASLPGFRVRVYRRSNGEVLHTLSLADRVGFGGANAAIIGIVPYPGAVYVGFAVFDNITPRPAIACQRTVVRDEAGVLVSESLSYLDTYYPGSSGNWLPASLGG